MDPAAARAGQPYFPGRFGLALRAIRLRAGRTVMFHLEYSRVFAKVKDEAHGFLRRQSHGRIDRHASRPAGSRLTDRIGLDR